MILPAEVASMAVFSVYTSLALFPSVPWPWSRQGDMRA